MVSFAGTAYACGRQWARTAIDVSIVAGSVQLSKDGQVILVRPSITTGPAGSPTSSDDGRAASSCAARDPCDYRAGRAIAEGEGPPPAGLFVTVLVGCVHPRHRQPPLPG